MHRVGVLFATPVRDAANWSGPIRTSSLRITILIDCNASLEVLIQYSNWRMQILFYTTLVHHSAAGFVIEMFRIEMC